jgi:hypothetical protein
MKTSPLGKCLETITFIRYIYSAKIGKLNNLKVFGGNVNQMA